jgi:hypothetical protein
MMSGKQQFVKFQSSESLLRLKSNCALLASETRIHGLVDLRRQIVFLSSKPAMRELSALQMLPDSLTL